MTVAKSDRRIFLASLDAMRHPAQAVAGAVEEVVAALLERGVAPADLKIGIEAIAVFTRDEVDVLHVEGSGMVRPSVIHPSWLTPRDPGKVDPPLTAEQLREERRAEEIGEDDKRGLDPRRSW